MSLDQPPRLRAVRITAPAGHPDQLNPEVSALALAPGADEALVEVRAAAVNPSDVKAALGAMPQAVWPRTPGRDYAGVVLDGPAAWLGRSVWGSSGQFGITRDGSHATHMVVPVTTLRAMPERLSFQEAASVGVPFVTAAQGFAEAGGLRPGETVLVLGSNGQVGQAAVQLAAQAGARVFAVARGERHPGAAAGPVEFIPAAGDIAATVRDNTDGHGADIIFNTVGSPYFEAGNKALAKLGRHIFIATIDRSVPFDILAFYRGRQRFIGVDSLALTIADTADLLQSLQPGFQAGTLVPPRIGQGYGLDRAADAYRAALGGEADGRVLLLPAGEPETAR